MTDTTPLDDDLARRLLDQRTILLGGVLGEAVDNRVCSVLAPPAQVREDTERDLVLTAEGAVTYGVVDAVSLGA